LYGDFENPFLDCEPPGRTAAVILVGHPGIGKQQLLQFAISHLPHDQEKAFGKFSRSYSESSQENQPSTTLNLIFNADGLYEVDFGQMFSASARA
jgi:hypothetical protein